MTHLLLTTCVLHSHNVTYSAYTGSGGAQYTNDVELSCHDSAPVTPS